MCLAVLAYQVYERHPVALGANRDEFYGRASRPPAPLTGGRLKVTAGVDLRRGGTWLGVNEKGLIACLTNRRTGNPEAPQRPSRGQLCREALQHDDPAAAAAAVSALVDRQAYNPFSMLLVSADQCLMASNWPKTRVESVAPGWHVLGNGELDAEDDTRVRRVRLLLDRHATHLFSGACLLQFLESVCRDHGQPAHPGRNSLCMHGPKAGTRSSSILILGPDSRIAAYRHAEGFPCRNAYEDVSRYLLP